MTSFIVGLGWYSKNQEKRFKFDWERGLSDVGDEFTSVELQHKALEWR